MANVKILEGLGALKITASVDFTTAEPSTTTAGDTYINTVTGTGSTTTGTTFTAGYLYTWDTVASDWVETTPTKSLRIYNEQALDIMVWTGQEWLISSPYTGAQERIYFVADAAPSVVVSHSSTLNFGNYGFTVNFAITPTVVSGTQYICNKETGGVGWGVYMVDDDLYIRYDDNVHDDSGKIADGVFEANVTTHVMICFDPTRGYAYAYFRKNYGGQQGAVKAMTAVATIDSASDLYIGSDSAGANIITAGFDFFRLINAPLPSAIANSMVLGGDGGAFYFVIDGSELMSEYNFATHSDWAVTGDFDDSGGNADLTWSADQTSTLTQASSAHSVSGNPLRIGVLHYDCAFTQESGSLALTLNSAFAPFDFTQGSFFQSTVNLPYTDGSHTKLFYVAGDADAQDFVITAVSSGGGAGDQIALDNVSLKYVGFVLKLGANDLAE